MSFRKSHAFTSLANSLNRLVRSRGHRRVEQRRKARRRFIEQLEPRNLMALNILSVSPADGEINWPLSTNLSITFDAAVIKGQGNIHVVRDATNTLGVAVDVNSPNVTILGSTVTVDLPTDLLTGQAYHVFIDNGAFLDATVAPTNGATLLTQNFDLLPLDPFDAGIGGGDGTDYTLVPPLNYSIDNSSMPTGGLAPFKGWSFLDKNSWIAQAGDQSRSAFVKGSGTVALGDPDQFDDATNGGAFNSKFVSRPIKLTGVATNSVVLEFDSSFRPEDSQIGTLDVRFDGGAWTNLLTLNPANTSNDGPSATVNPVNLNEHLTSGINTGVSTGGADNGKGNAPFRNIQNPAGASSMELRWGVVGQNDWWWAIDNVRVRGTVTGTPFLGVSNSTFWNLDIPRLTVSIDKTSMSENGGTAIGTVTRNGVAAGAPALIVNLVSNDTTEATVSATVTIPAGQLSQTFPITAVNDTIPDRTQTVLITASAPTFAVGSQSINVLDDEGPKIVTLSPADNGTGVDYKSNLSITFDAPVKKGNGLINIVRTNGNLLVASIDVNSPSVTISGAAVTIDPPINLSGLTEYYVLIDDGVFVDLNVIATTSTALLTQNFDLLPLRPFTSGTGGDGTDFTRTPPQGFAITGSTNIGNPDFDGWSFLDKNSWLGRTGGGGREGFTAGQGVVAVADASQWAGPTGQMDTFLTTTPIDLSVSGVAAGSAVLEFDATFKSGLPRLGVVEVSYDGGGSWTALAQFANSDVASSHVVVSSSGVTGAGATLINALSNPATGNMRFRFSIQFATSGWLAIDNIKVSGGLTGLTFQGISDPTLWNFTTAVAPTLTVTIDKTSFSENGGTAIGTVTRNLSTPTSPALTVNLNSSDITEATVPATAVIPAGAASITFPITAVDDLLGDGTQLVVITATAIDYFSVPASINVLDDDFPKATSLSPTDNATAVPVAADLVVTFDQPIKKGNGLVHIIRASDNKSAQSIDIHSSAVTISGNVVIINPANDLAGLSNYYVAFEDGAILNTASAVKIGATLLSQDFELLTLGPAVFETVGLTATGKDFTATPPTGYVVDNSSMPPGGVPEWNGWTFADKSFWQNQGGQGRSNFTLGQGTIAVGDTDEWDDTVQLNNSFNSLFITSPINLSQVVGNTAKLEFDSSFRPEGSSAANNQVGILEVSYDAGTSWSNLFTLDFNNTGSAATAPNVNEHKVVSVPNPSSGSMKFRFGVTGTNDWWWAIDNLKVTGDTNGLPYPGIANTDSASWNFTTAEAQTLTLSVAPTSIAENGGSATVTVTRNLGTTSALIVTLASSDTSIATVPASVTIPSGQASATFTVTAVDDTVADGLKNVTIIAASPGFVNGTSNVAVNDNEVVNVVVSEIMYAPGNGVRTEWIEVVNRGTLTADLGNWTFDDEDTTNWGKIPTGTLLAPGQVGVMYNSVFGSVTATTFRTDWKVTAGAVVVGMFWGDLANNPSAVGVLNENLLLLDAGNATIDQANYDDDGVVWPANIAGASIYLKNISSDNNIGTNWASSVVGIAGAVNPIGATFNLTDRGSPGVAPQAAVAPKVQNLVFGDGANQRSMVRSITVDFDQVVNIASGAFTLERKNGAIWDSLASELTVGVATSLFNNNTRATLTFTGTGISGGSLADGNYRLNMVASQITTNGLELDGNGNGTGGDNFVRGETAVDNFFRLYGDFDGNRLINAVDLGRFRLANGTSLGDASFNSLFDFNGDGVINAVDLGRFRIRNGTTLNF